MTTAAEALAIRAPRPPYEPESHFSIGSGNVQLASHFDLLLSKYNFYRGSPENSPSLARSSEGKGAERLQSRKEEHH